MSWRVKQFINKWAPIALIASVLFIGYTHHQRGGRANVSSVLTSARIAATKVPVIGSFFKKSRRYSPYRHGKRYKSYAYSKRRRYGHRSKRRRGRRR